MATTKDLIRTYHASTQYDLYFKYLVKYVEENPNDIEMVLHLGISYYKGTGCRVDYTKAFNIFNKLPGDPIALYYLGAMYMMGTGLEKNCDTAERMFIKSKKLGISQAIEYLIILYYDSGRFKEACEMCMEGIENNIPNSFYILGMLYFSGSYVERDIEKAVTYFEKSIENHKNKYAYAVMSRIYHEGMHGKQDYDKAFELGMKSRKLGVSSVLEILIDCLINVLGTIDDNDELLFDLCKKFVVACDIDPILKPLQSKAHSLLGRCYYYGRGVERDYKKSLTLFLSSADLMSSSFYLHESYYWGRGIDKDPEKSYEFIERFKDPSLMGGMYYSKKDYTKAFEYLNEADGKTNSKFYVYGMYYLAKCYHNGHGVQQSYKTAFEYLTQIDNLHRGYVLSMLGDYYFFGYHVEIDMKKAFDLYLEAALNGDSHGYLSLGKWYHKGINGTQQDYAKAFYYYRRATLLDNQEAISIVAFCYYHGIGTLCNLNEATRLIFRVLEFSEDDNYKLGLQYYIGLNDKTCDLEKALQYFNECSTDCKLFTDDIIKRLDFEKELIMTDKKLSKKKPSKSIKRPVVTRTEFMCPLTLSLITLPVMADDGMIYEKYNIVTWFKKSIEQYGVILSPFNGNLMSDNLVTL